MWGLQSRSVTGPLVRSYRTFSTLPEPFGHRRYVFCCTFRPLRALELRGTMPCGARTFLSGRVAQGDHPFSCGDPLEYPLSHGCAPTNSSIPSAKTIQTLGWRLSWDG